MKLNRKFFLCLFVLLTFSPIGKGKVVKQDHVEVQLVAPSVIDDGEFELGVHFKIEPHWHIYWKNPGDSGAAPKFQAVGAEILDVRWPFPVRLPVDSLTNYGYETEVLFPMMVKPTDSSMKLKLEWLVCKIECVPGSAELSITNKNIKIDKVLFEKFKTLVPEQKVHWETQFIGKDEKKLDFQFNLSADELSEIKNIFVFPENGEDFLTGLPITETNEKGLKISVPISSNAKFDSQDERFTFVVHETNNNIFSFSQSIPLRKEPTSLLIGLFLAFLGGLILNLMPCVFPVLFLKAFGFLKEENSAAIRKSSWQYAGGVIFTFIVVGGILSFLRYSGEAIGWGYQLQNPWVVYLLSLLFFAMGLNFYGFFEMGNFFTLQASKVSSNKFFSGSFGTGVLAVVVASPCTAPFMGSALGLALLLPAYLSILIFLALGVGMALPMVVLAYVPQLINRIPRSGAWMVIVKQFMSFPLFATGIWLLWVLGNQKGTDAILISLLSFLIFVLGLWILNVADKKLFRILGVLLLIAAPAFSIKEIAKANGSTDLTVLSAWTTYDEKILSESKSRQMVFIDFTASWCITCQVNKKTVLNTDEIQNLFKERNVLLMQADWTNQDPVITKALERFDRNSVPLYVFYNKMGEPKVLPEILTKEIIRDLFKGE